MVTEVLISNLDLQVAIETDFGLSQALLELQHHPLSLVDDDGPPVVVVDLNWLLRRRLLAVLTRVGGPEERQLPSSQMPLYDDDNCTILQQQQQQQVILLSLSEIKALCSDPMALVNVGLDFSEEYITKLIDDSGGSSSHLAAAFGEVLANSWLVTQRVEWWNLVEQSLSQCILRASSALLVAAAPLLLRAVSFGGCPVLRKVTLLSRRHRLSLSHLSGKSDRLTTLKSFDMLGIARVRCYATALGLLSPEDCPANARFCAQLSLVLVTTSHWFDDDHCKSSSTTTIEKSKSTDTDTDTDTDDELNHFHHSNNGFDWFAATIFLIVFRTNDSHSHWKALHILSNVLTHGAASFYLWPRSTTTSRSSAPLHNSSHVGSSSSSADNSGVVGCCSGGEHTPPPRVVGHWASTCANALTVSAHLVEMILQREFPDIYSIYTLARCPPSCLVVPWLRQCFWNVLSWHDIVSYTLCTLMLGIDYQVYFCVALLRHVHPQVHSAAALGDADALTTLLTAGVEGFSALDNLAFMSELAVEYRTQVLSAFAAALH
jgi:hypothetical protein